MDSELTLTWLIIIVVGILFFYAEFFNKNAYKNPIFFFGRLISSALLASLFIYKFINEKQPQYIIFGGIIFYDVYHTWKNHHTEIKS